MSDKETSKYDEDLEIGDMQICTIDKDEDIDFVICGCCQFVPIEEAKEIIKFLQHQIDKAK